MFVLSSSLVEMAIYPRARPVLLASLPAGATAKPQEEEISILTMI
jgi:hypothetical protein